MEVSKFYNKRLVAFAVGGRWQFDLRSCDSQAFPLTCYLECLKLMCRKSRSKDEAKKCKCIFV